MVIFKSHRLCFKSRERVRESYFKRRQSHGALSVDAPLSGRPFYAYCGCCRLLRIYTSWIAFLFLGEGLLGFRSSTTGKSLSEFSCLRGEIASLGASGVSSLVGGYSRGVFSESQHVELLRAPNRLLKSGEAIIEDMLLI